MGVSYERGTPAVPYTLPRCVEIPGLGVDPLTPNRKRSVGGSYSSGAIPRREASSCGTRNVQGYLAHKKHRPPPGTSLIRNNPPPQCRRVVLFRRNPETGGFELRHYVVNVKAGGLTKGIKKIVRRRSLHLHPTL